jgi:histidyl-tRNA synthetase
MDKYTLPRGTQDFLPEDTFKLNYIENVLKEVGALFDFHEIRTPIFEHTQLFTRSVGESSDIVNKEMYTFLDRSNRSITLRPEGTAGVVRAFVENKLYAKSDYPLKLYYNGPVFRYERPQAGRYRQIHQFGYECVGIKSPYMDAEMILMAASSLYILGIKNFTVKINSIGDTVSRNNYREALREYFKPHLEELCEDCNRRFTQNPLRILDCKVDAEKAVIKEAPKITKYLNDESKKYFSDVLTILKTYNLPYEVDENLVRGLDYYSDVVFEINVLKPDNTSYGAIGAGGRYDGLIEEVGGPSLPSVGYAFGVDRLKLIMEEYNLFNQIKDSLDAYVMPMDAASFNYAYQVAQFLRGNGIKAEMDYQMRSLKAQFKSVEKKNARFALIIGQDEVKNNTVTVKNTTTKEQITCPVNELIDKLNELYQRQFEVNEGGCNCGHHHDEDGHECHCEDGHECHCEDGHECCHEGHGHDEHCNCKHEGEE